MNDDSVVHRSRANIQLNPRAFEAAGGYLELTSDKLTFYPHHFNIGVREPIAIPLDQLESATPTRQLIAGRLPSPIPNAVQLIGYGGAFHYVVVVPNRRRWIQELEAAIDHRRADAARSVNMQQRDGRSS